MVNQGFFGALEQYWTVDEQPRLHRKNSWLREHEPRPSLLISAIYIAVPAIMGFIAVCMIGGLF